MSVVRTALLAGAVLLLAACSGSSAADSCDPIPGVRDGICPVPAEDRGDAPTDAMPTIDVEGLGEEISLEDFRGQVVVMNFWASWCGPCRVEQPDLNEAYEALDDDVVFFGVNISDSESNARAHLREFDVPYASAYDPNNVYAGNFRGIGPRSIPSTIFIDPDGRVAARVFGLIGTTEVIGLAEYLLGEGAADG